jgi:hypothetical protein
MEYRSDTCFKILKQFESDDGSRFVMEIEEGDAAQQEWAEHVDALIAEDALDGEVHRSPLVGNPPSQVKIFGLKRTVAEDLLAALPAHLDRVFSDLDALLAFLDELLLSQSEE